MGDTTVIASLFALAGLFLVGLSLSMYVVEAGVARAREAQEKSRKAWKAEQMRRMTRLEADRMKEAARLRQAEEAQEAARTLGISLSPPPSREAVMRAWRSAAKAAHPDSGSEGGREMLQRATNARNALLAHLFPRGEEDG